MYMEEINQGGVYEISASADGKMLNTADESIRLHLNSVDQKVIGLDQLLELRKKFILVCGVKKEMYGGGLMDKLLVVCAFIHVV